MQSQHFMINQIHWCIRLIPLDGLTPKLSITVASRMYYSNKKTTEISNPFQNQTVLSCILLIAIRLAQSAYVDDKTNMPSF